MVLAVMESSTSPPFPSMEPVKSQNQEKEDFIVAEPPMSYQPPKDTDNGMSQPIHERGPRMVVPLSQLQLHPAEVDCPFCRKVVKTQVREVSSDNDGLIMCLLCLVCWPLLCCYEGEKDIDHYCTKCQRKLTHKPHGGPVQVVAVQQQQTLVPSEFEQS